MLRRKKSGTPVADPALVERLAPEAVELEPDAVRFPGKAVLLPVTVRAEKALPGDPRGFWKALGPHLFFVGYPMWYSAALVKLPPGEAQQKVRFRRAATEALTDILARKLHRRPNPAEVQAIEHMTQIEGELALGRDVFRLHLMAAWTIPDDPTLRERAERLRRSLEGRIRAAGLLPQRLVYVPEQALYHLQPGGDVRAGAEPPGYVFVEEALGLLPRPQRRVPLAEDAVWLGVHMREGRDVYFSFSRGLDPSATPPTHNIVLVLGEQGSGKTTLIRLMLVQRLLQGRAVLSLDPEGEYDDLCRALGGEVVPVHPPEDPEVCLLHPVQGDTVEELFAAARFFLGAVLGAPATAPAAVAAVHQAVKEWAGRNPGRTVLPLSELRDALGVLGIPEARSLAASLAPYVRGGLWEGFFDRPRALLEPRLAPGEWRNFDLTRLREENKDAALAALAWFVHRAVTVGRNPMDVFVDEGWRLLRMPAFRDLLDELGRRGRKRDVGIVFATHLPRDLLDDPTSLALASTAFVGRLPPEAAEGLYLSLGMSPEQARNLAMETSRLGRGEFLAAPAAARGHAFPVKIAPPPEWLSTF